MKLWVSVSVLAVAALTLSRCQAAPSSPSSSTGPAATPINPNLKVDVKCPEFGESSRCSAFALSPDGGLEVTGLARWSTSSPAIATVTSTGLVTAVGTGEVSIQATYQGVSGYAIVWATPGQGLSGTSRNLEGTVLSLEGPLAGVLMEILNGPNAGRRTTTSASGYFSMTDLQIGQFSIRLSKSGYVTATYTWSIPGGQERIPTLTASR